MKRRVVGPGQGETQVYEWGSIRWIHSGSVSGSEELTLGEVVIKSGCENPLHAHSNCEEVLYLIEGELEHTCGDEPSYRLAPGAAICIQREIPHNARCVSHCDARMIVVYSAPNRESAPTNVIRDSEEKPDGQVR